ncbi:MAG: glucosamine-6-phosphate deaminase [Mucilaginibacter sp.]
MREFKVDQLNVHICANRAAIGRESAIQVGRRINELLAQQEYVNIIFAAAPSQNEFLAALRTQTRVDWRRINAFHMDEYIGLPANAPQSFGSFLKEKLFGWMPFNSVNYINGNATDLQAECERYALLLTQYPPDIVCMGIGENGHIAFNDPPVADFSDPLMVKIVELDAECRQQQVNDGCFGSLDQVPTHALTLTVPALMAGKYVYCMVPGKNKAKAVFNTLTGGIDEQCPASILRKHTHAILFLDKESSVSLNLDVSKSIEL